MNNDENTNKTKWIKKKKNIFSDSSNNIDEDFQTMNMKQKIMNILKKKKAKALHKENYKNIELLQNIYDDDSTNDIDNVNIKPRENFTDKDFDGIDIPDPNREKKTYENPILGFFENIFDRIDRFNYEKAKFLADIFSKKTATEKDILLLKYYIALFESIGVSYFATYNWYFYMFYNENSITNESKQFEWSEVKQKEASKTNPFISLYMIFCNFCIKYTEYLQIFMLHILPPLCSAFNRTTTFVLLFFSLIIVFFFWARTLNDTIIDAVNMKLSNIFVVIMFLILLFNYLPSPWIPAKSDDPIDVEIANAMFQAISSSIYLIVPFLIIKTIIALGILYFTIPFGATLLMLYFLYYSIFGVFSFNSFRMKTSVEMFKNIYKYIKMGDKVPEIKDVDKDSFMYKFIIVMNNFFDSLHRYILYIAYIIMLLVGMVDYYNHIESIKLKTNLLIVSFTLILIFGSLSMAGFMTHGLSEAGEIYNLHNNVKEITSELQVQSPIEPPTASDGGLLDGLVTGLLGKLTSK